MKKRKKQIFLSVAAAMILIGSVVSTIAYHSYQDEVREQLKVNLRLNETIEKVDTIVEEQMQVTNFGDVLELEGKHFDIKELSDSVWDSSWVFSGLAIAVMGLLVWSVFLLICISKSIWFVLKALIHGFRYLVRKITGREEKEVFNGLQSLSEIKIDTDSQTDQQPQTDREHGNCDENQVPESQDVLVAAQDSSADNNSEQAVIRYDSGWSVSKRYHREQELLGNLYCEEENHEVNTHECVEHIHQDGLTKNNEKEDGINLLKNRCDALARQVAELEDTEDDDMESCESIEMAAVVSQPAPIQDTLKTLTEEISAIRQYASQQQVRVQRFQEGYDLNIIRSFCLRVIRCLDNLEDRIVKRQQEGLVTTDLEDVHDELLFALESSGIEPIEPTLNTEYRGQEKYAEAMKAKEPCDDEQMHGKIAKVVRKGYQYMIDEENFKLVRAAQVKLFG